MFSTTNVSEKFNMHGFGRMLSYEQNPEEKSRLWLSSFKKKIDQTSWRTTRRNYKQLPQILCISSRFRVLHLLSWECMSFETCWSRLIYTKLSSHRSFVINMYVVTMAWRCISPWSFHRSPQRRQEMNIFGCISRFPRILSKNNKK